MPIVLKIIGEGNRFTDGKELFFSESFKKFQDYRVTPWNRADFIYLCVYPVFHFLKWIAEGFGFL